MRILIAEDHQMVRQGLRVLLETKCHAEVTEAQNGRAAVDLAIELRPDIVVMDLTMPDLNGIDATRQILAQRPKTKVIAISARTDSKLVSSALHAGAVGFVPKESAFEELALAVTAVQSDKVYLSPQVAAGVLNRTKNPTHNGNGNGNAETSDELTGREREVLQLTSEGSSMKEIATRLDVSVKTIETHRRRIMDKLHLYSVAELTKYAIREGITSN